MKRIFPVLIFIFVLYLGNSALASTQSSYIRGWLICGPFEGSDLETECFKNEAQVTPKEGDVSGGKEWKLYSSSGDMVDFEDKELFGAYDFCDGYAYIEVKSPQRKEVRLLLGSDDGIKVWLNGRNILTNDIPRGFGVDADKLNVILEPGWNRLLLKINDIGGQWCFSARFSDYQNSPVGDLEYRPKSLKMTPVEVKEATASSVEGGKTSFSAANVIDGDPSTRWSSAGKDPQWVLLDLGASVEINRVVLTWEAAYAQSYKIEISNDKENWTEVYSTNSNEGGRNTITLKEPKAARYVRLYCIKRANENWGNSLWEFQVFAPETESP